jgi:heterodisulfide reductase subunit C
LPRFAHATAISRCESFGVQMSTASTSSRAMSAFQSVSRCGTCHASAKAARFVAFRPHTACSTGRRTSRKKWPAWWIAFAWARPMKP